MADNCPHLLLSGSCPDANCNFNHNISVCELCNFVLPNAATYTAHMNSRRHRIKAAGTGITVHCPICKKTMISGNWPSHIAGQRHRNAANSKQAPVDADAERPISIPGHNFCDLCQSWAPQSTWAAHTQSIWHTRREKYVAFRSTLDEAEKDKHGITIEGQFNFGIVDPNCALGIVSSAAIKTVMPSSKVTLIEIRLASSTSKDPFTTLGAAFSAEVQDPNRSITSAHFISVRITFRQKHIGRYEDRLELVFKDVQLKKRFIISRALRVIIGSKSDHETLKAKAPYVPRPRTTRQAETEVIPGIPPPSLKAIPYVGSLPRADIPEPLLSVLTTGSLSETIKRVRKVFLPQTVDSASYARHFKHLLWIEEFRMDRDLEKYDMTDATLTKHQPYYYLDIPGLAEKRPSILIGDRILVHKHDTAQGRWFEGGVHVTRKEEVGLRFHGSFGWAPGQRFNVHFKLNRIPLRRQHQALDTAFSQDRVLFPSNVHLPKESLRKSPIVRLRFFNPLISTNPPQLHAVSSIVGQPPGAVPFVIFGPPGTGKTITIIEAIRQILSSNPNARVLACAPSNSAADLIASRLNALTTNQLFRFYAPSRHKGQVPHELLSYTYVDDDGHFSVPPMARMKQFRVVVTTCVSASVASGIGIPRGHYSHIFIDEAGQATEPEAVVSIKTMADNSTNIILSGDPKQLGPIVRSSIARQLGLETSYIERLMSREIYDVKKGYSTSVIKLVKNFRSHNAILTFPNERFYSNDLQPCADPKVTNSFLGSSYLPSKKFPIVFHAISGKDDREASSPSFFNIDEITQVKSYVSALRDDRVFRTTDNDIGIITPYHAQCLKIRASLRNVADSVKVGSVEEFQGQERRVIIISTVRSSKEFVEYDLKHTLGFVTNPRRFNVAVTRAQALLIIVGDPQVLSLDPLWRSFLNYIHLNNGWTGPPISWDPHTPIDEAGGYDLAIREAAQTDMNSFSRRMEILTLEGVGEDEETEDAQVDRPWRDVE